MKYLGGNEFYPDEVVDFELLNEMLANHLDALKQVFEKDGYIPDWKEPSDLDLLMSELADVNEEDFRDFLDQSEMEPELKEILFRMRSWCDEKEEVSKLTEGEVVDACAGFSQDDISALLPPVDDLIQAANNGSMEGHYSSEELPAIVEGFRQECEKVLVDPELDF